MNQWEKEDAWDSERGRRLEGGVWLVGWAHGGTFVDEGWAEEVRVWVEMQWLCDVIDGGQIVNGGWDRAGGCSWACVKE